ncbi:bola-like protein [Meredithblackwellia eburnea MCA 4105]
MSLFRRQLTGTSRQVLASIRPSAASSSSLLLARPFSSTSPSRSEQSEGEQLLKTKLLESFKDAKVEVQDVSGGCGTFYAVSIAHPSFKGLTMIKQHRAVNAVLKDDIKGMHGIQVSPRLSLSFYSMPIGG